MADYFLLLYVMSHYSQSKVVAALGTLYIFRMLGLFMVLPVIALSGDDYVSSSVFLLGVALGIYGLTQALLQIPFGMLSDRFGRKPLILLGLVLFALGSIIAACADSMVGLIIGRALQGSGAVAGVIMAMVGDLTSDKNRTKAMAAIGASIGLAFALSIVLGPLVSSWDIYGVTGIRLLFWLSVILSLAGIVILWLAIPTPSSTTQLKSRSSASPISLSHLSQAFNNKQYLSLYSGIFVLHYVLMVFFLIIPSLLEEIVINRETHSWFYLGVMVCSFIVMIPMMIVGEKKQKIKPLMLGNIGLISIALLVVLVSHLTLGSLLVCLMLFFIGFNYLEANLPSLLSKQLPQSIRGAGSGVFASSQFMGAALGGVIGGGLYAQWGIVAAFGSAILLLLLWSMTLVKSIIPYRQSATLIDDDVVL